MVDWWDAFLFYARPETLLQRWESGLFALGMIALVISLELCVVGWSRSTLGIVMKFRGTDKWDLISLFLQVTGLQKILTNIFFIGFIGYLVIVTKNISVDVFSGSPFWARFVSAIFLYDFLMYWNHRIRHEWDWLWIVHEYHHSSTEITVLTDSRTHPLDYIVYFLTTGLIMKIFVISEVRHIIWFLVVTWVPSLIAHSRLDTSFGWLGRYIIVSPRFHHLHHEKGEAGFKNYGLVFIIWDRVFGTYLEPSKSIRTISQGLLDEGYKRRPLKSFLVSVIKFYQYPARKIGKLYSFKASSRSRAVEPKS